MCVSRDVFGVQLISMPSGNPKAVEDRLIKANELARKAMQFAATGVNIKKAVERFIVELEARKDIPPKMLYGVFNLVAPYDQSVRPSALLSLFYTTMYMCSDTGFVALV